MIRKAALLRTYGTEATLPFASLICVNGLSYVFLVVFSRTLSPPNFLGYTGALAVVMLAIALAEAGIVYAAPPFLRARKSKRSARFAGGFVTISTCILFVVTASAALIWKAIGVVPLDMAWIARVIALMAPNLILQNWLLARFSRPILLLICISLFRAIPLLMVVNFRYFDSILFFTFFTSILVFLLIGIRGDSFRRPGARDFLVCIRVVRGFMVLRLFSTMVTSSAPFLLGLLSSPVAVAAYILGDRTKALVSSAFQPFVQGMYLLQCRKKDFTRNKLFQWIVLVLIICVVISALVLSFASKLINDAMYAGRYPDSSKLGYFLLSGHLAVLSSIGYFLFMIPNGYTKLFVKIAMIQGALFVGLILVFTKLDPITAPALSVFLAELFLFLSVLYVVAKKHGLAFFNKGTHAGLKHEAK